MVDEKKDMAPSWRALQPARRNKSTFDVTGSAGAEEENSLSWQGKLVRGSRAVKWVRMIRIPWPIPTCPAYSPHCLPARCKV